MLIMLPVSKYAAVFTVTNTSDSGAGSLRQAITSANSSPNSSILFNIPTADPGYNPATGVFTINVLSLLPPIQMINITIDATSQPGNTNPYGPEICLKGNASLNYGICVPTTGNTVKGFIINGFYCGVLVYKSSFFDCNNNTVSNCYIGVNYDGTLPDPNEIGVAVMNNATLNTVKDNLIAGNILAGVIIRSSSSNTVQGNKIGTDVTGMLRIPNFYGLVIDTASSNLIGGPLLSHRNIISGNYNSGIAINSSLSSNNVIKGNYIGTNVVAAGSADSLSNLYGIAINESFNNIIGGSGSGERNIISGNSGSGIIIMGQPATGNSIKGNYIGTNSAGTDSISNGNGILLSGAGGNFIGSSVNSEKNVISGNRLAGIVISYYGARNNIVKGNYIGTDRYGMNPLSNHTGIYIFSNANSNIVGGSLSGERNIISANIEMGICMEAADSNVVMGNYIGPDSTGLNAFKFSNDTLIQGNGLYFNSNAAHNIAGGYNPGEGNIISGNRVYGLVYYGNSPYNSCIGNYIGVDRTGNVKLPNTTGICVDGGANHNPIINNVLSGNLAYGIFIVTTGTYYNELKGNLIGTNASGTDSVPNQIGVILGGGTKYNTIGGDNPADRNIISGNYFDGIEIADSGTMFNNIKGNYVGTDISGTVALPNYIGIGFATLPSKNNVENNLISGNNYIGLLFFEHSDSNTVYSNKIGTAADGVSPLGNTAAGIVIEKESKYNMIGGAGKGNIVAYNDTAGIILSDTATLYNTLSENIIHSNGLMNIDIYPFGINPNDSGDYDNGCNGLMNYPVINNVIYDSGSGLTYIDGTIDYQINGGPAGIKIEVFEADGMNLFGHGDPVTFLSGATAAASGNWNLICSGVVPPAKVTATATDLLGNTSELSLNADVITGIFPAEEKLSAEQFVFYPNPAREYLHVSILNPEFSEYTLELISVSGSNSAFPAVLLTMQHSAINLHSLNIQNGVYFVKLLSGNECLSVKKLVIIR